MAYRMDLDHLPAIIPPEFHDGIEDMFRPAIEACREGDPDRLIVWAPFGELDRMHAFQIVTIFGLDDFVLPRRCDNVPPPVECTS